MLKLEIVVLVALAQRLWGRARKRSDLCFTSRLSWTALSPSCGAVWAAMTGGSVEVTLELWALSLRDVKGRIRPLFQQERMAVSAGLFLDALLGPERRKTGWMRAEAAGDPGRWRQQALLGRAQWARMLCVTWCATTPSRPSLSQMPCWFWTRRAS